MALVTILRHLREEDNQKHHDDYQSNGKIGRDEHIKVSILEGLENAGANLYAPLRDAYRSCLYSFASAERFIRPAGALGEWLMENLATWRRFNQREVYCLGDSPLVLLSSLQTFFEPDTASSDFTETAAPYVTEDGKYDLTRKGRVVRVYTRLDTALMFKDMEDKIAIFAR